MDEWMVDRPHNQRFCGVVCEGGEREPKRGRLLAPRPRIDNATRRRWHFDPSLHHGQNRTEITFGRDPNHGLEKALTRRQPRFGLGLAEPRAFAGGEDGTGDGNDPKRRWTGHGCHEKRVGYRS
jgi:hypothetical protein